MFPPPLLWTNLAYFPIGFEMPFLPGVGVILLLASLLQLLGNLTLAYNLLWLLSFLLSGYTMYALGRSLFRQRAVAFLCGVLFMFSSYYTRDGTYTRGSSRLLCLFEVSIR